MKKNEKPGIVDSPERETGIETEERILAAARRVFIRKGLTGARMQEIADEAGINKALLHYYFRSKDRLFEIVFQEAFQKLIPDLFETMASPLPFEEKIRYFFQRHIDFLEANPFIPAFMIHEINQNPGRISELFRQAAFSKGTLGFEQQIEADVIKGRIRPISLPHLMLNLISLSAFPFLARPLFQQVFQMDDASWSTMMHERKELLAEFFIQALKIPSNDAKQ